MDPNPLMGKPQPTIASLDPTAGFVGQKVTIDGANFGASQSSGSVTFNGTPATPTTWSATRIETAVPDGVTTGPVVVTVDADDQEGGIRTVGRYSDHRIAPLRSASRVTA